MKALADRRYPDIVSLSNSSAQPQKLTELGNLSWAFQVPAIQLVLFHNYGCENTFWQGLEHSQIWQPSGTITLFCKLSHPPRALPINCTSTLRSTFVICNSVQSLNIKETRGISMAQCSVRETDPSYLRHSWAKIVLLAQQHDQVNLTCWTGFN